MNKISGVLSADFTLRYQYDIHFTKHLFSEENPLVRQFFESADTKGHTPKILFMIDQGVLDHHPDLKQQISDYFQTIPGVQLIEDMFSFPGGEIIKNEPQHLDKMLQVIDQYGIDRHSIVAAIGGGALLDAAGYAAAISHRGVRHIRIPTTVLSQNDSGIGVKNGVNYFNKKNYLGSFAPPLSVWIDQHFLTTLEERDLRSGISEAIKVALIRDKTFFEWLEKNSTRLARFEEEVMQYQIKECARLHLNHITGSGDPFERGSARPLDFGHWAAHKLEDLTDYSIRHGEAVAIGIALDTTYSRLMGTITEKELNRTLQLFRTLGFDIFHEALMEDDCAPLFQGLNEFREHLGGRLTITLLEGIGKGVEVHEIDHDKMKEALHRLSHHTHYHEN